MPIAEGDKQDALQKTRAFVKMMEIDRNLMSVYAKSSNKS